VIQNWAWAGNKEALFAIKREMKRTPGLKGTVPEMENEEVLGF
jgi:urocanate hydratase